MFVFQIQQNHFPQPSPHPHPDVSHAPPPTSAENQSLEPHRPEKHIEENHIIENHYDEFGNPYDPNQSSEIDEEDEGEITNVDIHTYSSDDQGGSSHTHYTKNNGGSHESFEQTSPSGTGELTGKTTSFDFRYSEFWLYKIFVGSRYLFLNLPVWLLEILFTIEHTVILNFGVFNFNRLCQIKRGAVINVITRKWQKFFKFIFFLLSVDHGAQSSSYENSNSYYTIPPDVNIHHYNMHREYDQLLSKEPNLLGDYNPRPIILNQYEVHENTEEDTSNNNLGVGQVQSKPTTPQLSTTPSSNEINTNHLNLVSSNYKVPDIKKYQYAKHFVKQVLDNKHGKNVVLPSLNENIHNSLHNPAMKIIISPNNQLKQNTPSPDQFSFSKPPTYFLDQNLPNRNHNSPLNFEGNFPFKSITVNNEKLPAITLSHDSNIHIRPNPKFLNMNNPFNHRFIPTNFMKSSPSISNTISPYTMHSTSYFNSKDFLKPLYSFQHLPQLQPLFKADASNRNNVFFPNMNKNFNVIKLKPQTLADYSYVSPSRQNYVRTVIMTNRKDDLRNLESMRPPPPAQQQTWDKQNGYQQIVPDSYAKITLPKSIYHLNLIKSPSISSPNISIAAGG